MKTFWPIAGKKDKNDHLNQINLLNIPNFDREELQTALQHYRSAGLLSLQSGGEKEFHRIRLFFFGLHSTLQSGLVRLPPLMAAASAGVPPPLKVLRTGTVGCVTIRVVAGDIAECATAAVVNAANALSFMPMDAGVSGALRNRCRPVDVTQRPKRWWDDEGNEHYTDRLPETQAGVQAAAGALAAQGVRYVVHAVGPNWNDHSIGPRAFMVVVPKIRRTVQRALEAADRSGAASCTLPALSGGIFTHWREHSNIQAREQLSARRAVLSTMGVRPTTRNPQRMARNPRPVEPNPRPMTRNPRPMARNPRPVDRTPRPDGE